MKRTRVLGMLAVLVVLTACGLAEAGPKSEAPARGGRTFNSKVALDVYMC